MTNKNDNLVRLIKRLILDYDTNDASIVSAYNYMIEFEMNNHRITIDVSPVSYPSEEIDYQKFVETYDEDSPCIIQSDKMTSGKKPSYSHTVSIYIYKNIGIASKSTRRISVTLDAVTHALILDKMTKIANEFEDSLITQVLDEPEKQFTDIENL